MSGFNRSPRQRKLAVVLTAAKVTALPSQLNGLYYLMAALL
ncbi:hypothetical protein ADIMK_3619 [Marinobacterium lacunae]|uniref:Uncharacterized protein n=1 Tax=Marinobacterium lacunae TaxID=1232683 RepID=A0A081FTV3_9GAMM|nr:hypothetical protein ADIMK_3619 [Marinobacterium lacunae]